MPSEEVVTRNVYSLLNGYFKDNYSFKYYYCGNPVNFYYQFGSSDTWKPEDTLICVFTKSSSIFVGSDKKITDNGSATVIYSKDKNPTLNSVGQSKNYTYDVNSTIYSNIPITNNSFANNSRGKDILLSTDFYQKQRDEELKELLSSSSSNTPEPVNIDFTSTNTILLAILLSICFIICLGMLRKIFNRGGTR